MKHNKNTIRYFHKPALLGGASLLAILAAQQSVHAQEATPVPPVTVTAPAEQPLDGSAAAGYRVGESTASGPIWGDLPVQDAPYSLSVVSSPLIENLQATDIEDIAKVIPQITNVYPLQNKSGNPWVIIRGFSISEFRDGAGQTYDGLLGGAGGMLFTTLEDKERVEVLSGVDGFLYGTGAVGGNVNYVLKRPTATPYYSLTMGDNAGDNFFMHADLGGPLKFAGIADGLFGYRLNLVYQDGNTSIDNQSVKRNLESVAFDVHLPYGALLQFNAAHYDYHLWGPTPEPFWPLNPQPAPPNGALNTTPSWVQFADRTYTVGTKLTWKVNDIFTLRSAWDFTREERYIQDTFFTSGFDYTGNVSASAQGGGPSDIWYTNSGYTFLDTSFLAFGVQQKITTGFTGFEKNDAAGGNGTAATYSMPYPVTNIYNPANLGPQPPYNGVETYKPGIDSHQFGENSIVADEIKIGQFTLLAGGNYANLGTNSYISHSGYEKAALTPTVSLIYKILPWFTTYATYQQSLQAGVDVENTTSRIYTNNGDILPPYISNQYEVGAKATVAKGVLLTIAFFDIDKANQYQVNNGNGTWTYEQSGQEVHKGVELTGTGKLTDDLTLVGGITAMDARVVNDQTNPAGNGSVPAGVSPFDGKLYAEYTIPILATAPFLHSLTLIGGITYSSWSYFDYPNTTKLPGYAVEDVGFRYATALYDHPLIIRFNVNNVTNHAYWEAGGSLAGPPRTFLASAQMKW
jgi:iron complex outermembrane recepter protein